MTAPLALQGAPFSVSIEAAGIGAAELPRGDRIPLKLSICHPPSADREEPGQTQEPGQRDHGPL